MLDDITDHSAFPSIAVTAGSTYTLKFGRQETYEELETASRPDSSIVDFTLHASPMGSFELGSMYRQYVAKNEGNLLLELTAKGVGQPSLLRTGIRFTGSMRTAYLVRLLLSYEVGGEGMRIGQVAVIPSVAPEQGDPRATRSSEAADREDHNSIASPTWGGRLDPNADPPYFEDAIFGFTEKRRCRRYNERWRQRLCEWWHDDSSLLNVVSVGFMELLFGIGVIILVVGWLCLPLALYLQRRKVVKSVQATEESEALLLDESKGSRDYTWDEKIIRH